MQNPIVFKCNLQRNCWPPRGCLNNPIFSNLGLCAVCWVIWTSLCTVPRNVVKSLTHSLLAAKIIWLSDETELRNEVLKEKNHQRFALLALYERNLQVIVGFPAQRASNSESTSMCHHVDKGPCSCGLLSPWRCRWRQPNHSIWIKFTEKEHFTLQ